MSERVRTRAKVLAITGLEDPDFERECTEMFTAGITWLVEHPRLVPEFAGYKSVTGVIVAKNQFARELEAAMLAPLGDIGQPMTATKQAVLSHVLYWRERFTHHRLEGLEPEAAWRTAYNDLYKFSQSLKGKP